MLPIEVSLTGDRLIVLRLAQLEQAVHDRFNIAVHELTEELLARIIAAEPERTGRLRRQTRAFFRDSATRISGTVRAAARKADMAKVGALEFGAHGEVKVRSYEMANGKIVSAYQRRVNIIEEKFLRASFADMEGTINDRFRQELDKMLADVEAS